MAWSTKSSGLNHGNMVVWWNIPHGTNGRSYRNGDKCLKDGDTCHHHIGPRKPYLTQMLGQHNSFSKKVSLSSSKPSWISATALSLHSNLPAWEEDGRRPLTRRRPSTSANKTKIPSSPLKHSPKYESKLRFLITSSQMHESGSPNRTLKSNNNISQASSERLGQGFSINRQGVSGLTDVSIKTLK